MSFIRAPFFLWVGLRHFTKAGYERAKSTLWTDEERLATNISLQNQHIIITGANQGIGFDTSLQLAKRQATVYMVCRNEARGKAAVDRVRTESKNNDVHLRVCDVSSLSSINSFAKDFVSSGIPLYALVNNAGVLLDGDGKSVDGYEINFATNTLGSFALTHALYPALKRAASESTGSSPRVIFVSSGGALTENLEIDDLEAKQMNPYVDGTKQYARDKRRQIVMAEEFAKRWSRDGILVVSCHPGWVDTVGVQQSIPKFHSTFKTQLRNLEEGSDGIVYLCCAGKLIDGGFYLDRKVQAKHLPLAGTQHKQGDADKLMALLMDMVGKHSSVVE